MHLLKTHTITTQQPDSFLVYWTNSLTRPGGLLKVRVKPDIEDRHIAAELAAMQHLLEDKCAIGKDVVGNACTKLVVSLGAIKKLHRKQSDKAHLAPYANFLRTRFAGCALEVDKDARWFDGLQPELAEDLLVSGPRGETINVAGLGEVTVTQHVLERFADRVLAETEKNKVAQAAWKKLVETASDPSVREVARHGIWTASNHTRPGKKEGRYYLNAKLKLVMVVTDNPGEGKRLVTTYPASRQFHDLAEAA